MKTNVADIMSIHLFIMLHWFICSTLHASSPHIFVKQNLWCHLIG